MLLATLIFGSLLGFCVAVFAYATLGAGLLAAFGIYLGCALVPTLLAAALTAAQLALEGALRNLQTAR